VFGTLLARFGCGKTTTLRAIAGLVTSERFAASPSAPPAPATAASASWRTREAGSPIPSRARVGIPRRAGPEPGARPTLTQPARVDDRRCSIRSIFATLRLEAPNANSDSSQAWTTVFADSGPMTRAPRVRIWALLLFRARSAE
jgi:energy-coupling factor transporter ATP-binding protein EcfA2